MDSYLDHLPSLERERIRKKLRSPEAYEKLREKVKGPEDLERELDRSEMIAEGSFQMETEPQFKETLKEKVMDGINEQGVEEVFEGELTDEQIQALEEGNFDLSIESHPETHDDQLTVLPSGNIAEKLPVKQGLGDSFISGLLGRGSV